MPIERITLQGAVRLTDQGAIRIIKNTPVNPINPAPDLNAPVPVFNPVNRITTNEIIRDTQDGTIRIVTDYPPPPLGGNSLLTMNLTADFASRNLKAISQGGNTKTTRRNRNY